MSEDLVWKNVVAYCLQVGLLVGLASFVPAALRLRMPRARLVYWQILLVACLVLPQVQTWQRETIASSVEVSTVVTGILPSGTNAPRKIPVSRIALAILIGGTMVRLGWLATGFWRLRCYRRRSQRLTVPTPWSTRAELRLSSDIASPVTFGIREPVVLLPSKFPELDGPTQEAILCHELLHVERRDWLFAVGEELVRAVFWFHPAIWWLLGEIQLAREQAVDREVIDLTQSRDHYVDALLAIAGSRPQLDLAPAPMLLRRRHLKQRVISILKDARMSRARVVTALASSLGILLAVVWLASNTFPLAAARRSINDPAAVSSPSPRPAVYQDRLYQVDLQRRRAEEEERAKLEEKLKAAARERMLRARAESFAEPKAETAANTSTPAPERIRVGGNVQQNRLVKQPRPAYPAEAKQARIQGKVELRAVIAKDGTIQQLEVISGHPMLVPAALEAVRQWVYEPTLLNTTPVEVVTQIDVNFTLSQ